MLDTVECLPFITFAFVNMTTFLTEWECKDFSQFLTRGVFFFETKEHSPRPYDYWGKLQATIVVIYLTKGLQK